MSAPTAVSSVLPVKITYNGILRRFNLSPSSSIDWILTKVEDLFSKDASTFALTWLDEDEDWVSLVNDEDLTIAIDVATSTGKSLKLNVSDKSDLSATMSASFMDAAKSMPISNSAPSTAGPNDPSDWEFIVEEQKSAKQSPSPQPPSDTPDHVTEAHHTSESKSSPTQETQDTDSITEKEEQTAPASSSSPTTSTDSEDAHSTLPDAGQGEKAQANEGSQKGPDDRTIDEQLFEAVHDAMKNVRENGILDLSKIFDQADNIGIENLICHFAPQFSTFSDPTIFASFAPVVTPRWSQYAAPGSPCGRGRCWPTSHDSGTKPSPQSAALPGNVLPRAPLSFGSKGPGVEQLQRYLIKHGFMDASAIRRVAGFYGPRTAHSISTFQHNHDLTAGNTPKSEQSTRGIFDEATRTALLMLHRTTGQSPSSNEDVRTRNTQNSPVAQDTNAKPRSESSTGNGSRAVPTASASAQQHVKDSPADQEISQKRTTDETSTSCAAEKVNKQTAENKAGAEPNETSAETTSQGTWEEELKILHAMGFENIPHLIEMLDEAQGSVLAVVTKLIK